MKRENILFIFSLACLYNFGEALFFGPTAVGLGLGVLAFKKGLILGGLLSGSRTSRSYDSRSYHYNPTYHYRDSYYSKPRQHYYYSSSQYRRYNRYGRKKRDVSEDRELLELHRAKREIERSGFDMNGWYRNMTEMDQDSCSKKLVCELRAKQSSGKLSEEESIIAEKFGNGGAVDVSDITVEFDLASQVGKYMGIERCIELYKRCTFSSDDMVNMIKTEFDNLKQIQEDLDANEVSLDEELALEENNREKEIIKLRNENTDKVEELWVWGSK